MDKVDNCLDWKSLDFAAGSSSRLPPGFIVTPLGHSQIDSRPNLKEQRQDQTADPPSCVSGAPQHNSINKRHQAAPNDMLAAPSSPGGLIIAAWPCPRPPFPADCKA